MSDLYNARVGRAITFVLFLRATYVLASNRQALPDQTTYKNMKKSSLSLTALLLSLTALLLSALLLTSCGNKEGKGTPPKAPLGKVQVLNSLPPAYGSPLEQFTQIPA
jgi:hypothetical protein